MLEGVRGSRTSLTIPLTTELFFFTYIVFSVQINRLDENVQMPINFAEIYRYRLVLSSKTSRKEAALLVLLSFALKNLAIFTRPFIGNRHR